MENHGIVFLNFCGNPVTGIRLSVRTMGLDKQTFSEYNSKYRSVPLVLVAFLREYAYSADLPWLPKFSKKKKKFFFF